MKFVVGSDTILAFEKEHLSQPTPQRKGDWNV
jgi:hypothetical protein